MTYFPDMSVYGYIPALPNMTPTTNVGWLDSAFDFARAVPSEDVLERLWRFSSISVSPTRGLHACPFCAPTRANFTERNGVKMLLGSAEIRVFTQGGSAAFASPNLLYHYVAVHQYQPPLAFLEALKAGPEPADSEYQEMLSRAHLRWTATPLLDHEPIAFRFVKRGAEIVKEIFNSNPTGSMSSVEQNRWRLADDLRVGKVSPGEFCLALGTTTEEAPQFALTLLHEAVAESSADLVEFGLFVGFRFGFPSQALRPLIELATVDWHRRHEDVVSALGKMRSDESVEALFAAANSHHAYLAYDEAFALGVKAIWSLGGIETQGAVARLNDLRHSGNLVLQDAAAAQLARVAQRASSFLIRELAEKALDAL